MDARAHGTMTANALQPIETSEVEARRVFLANCAKYAIGMPPAIALLLSARSASGCHNQGQGQDQKNCSGLAAASDPEFAAEHEQQVDPEAQGDPVP